MDDIAVVMRDLSIERAHLVGLSMGAYAALQFGLLHPEKVSAIVAAAVGSGSPPSHRDAWLKETAVLSRIFNEHGMRPIAERMGRGPARIQLRYKDQKTWQEFVDHLRDRPAWGMSNTMTRCQALRPSLHDLRDQLSEMAAPILLVVGDEDTCCLETNLMLKSALPNAGLWICPNTGHAINLEEPAAFNAHVESFLSAVERGLWRRAYRARSRSSPVEHRPACRSGSPDHTDEIQIDAGVQHSHSSSP